MIRKLLLLLVVLGVAGFGVFWLLTAPRALGDIDADFEGDVENGEVMFWTGGCVSCHAAPGSTGEDLKKLAGGLALPTAFGTFYTPNISPDPNVGIGGWSTLDFVNAMSRGVSPSGRHYYPAFPYTSYQRMDIQDLVDLKAYLDTLPAVASTEKRHEVSFPFNLRRGIGIWKLIYLDGKPFEPDPKASDEVNRGAYLVQGPGHCGECHTPRDWLGGTIRARALGGAPHPAGKGHIPNITSGEKGIGSWSVDEIVEALTSGLTPEFDSLGGEMAKVVHSLSQLSDDDRNAIAAYLKTVPAQP